MLFKICENGNIGLLENSTIKFQIIVTVLIMLSSYSVPLHRFNMVFQAPPTNFSCIETNLDQCADDCPEHIFDRSTFTETIITEWDLVCKRYYLQPLTDFSNKMGTLLGCLTFGFLSDRFGRKYTLAISVMLQVLFGSLVRYSNSFGVFVFTKFLTSVAVGGSMVIGIVLILELISIKWRATASLVYLFFYHVGHLSLPLFSYLLRDWRELQLAVSLPQIVLISYFWILPESPRWLLINNKKEAAIQVLGKAAKHKEDVSLTYIRKNVDRFIETKIIDSKRKKGDFRVLFTSSVIRSYTFCLSYLWLACGLSFFGGLQYVNPFNHNIFLNVVFSAFIPIPGALFAFWSINAWGRKKTTIFGFIVASLAWFLLTAVNEQLIGLTIILISIQSFGTMISFSTIFIYCGELFPTFIRNTAMGTTCMCARIGASLVPLIRSFSNWITPFIFGVVCLLSCLVCLLLPETKDTELPDTVEDVKEFAKTRRRSRTNT